jgi:hypothetical protein
MHSVSVRYEMMLYSFENWNVDKIGFPQDIQRCSSVEHRQYNWTSKCVVYKQYPAPDDYITGID